VIKCTPSELLDRRDSAIGFIDINAGVAVADLWTGGQIPVYVRSGTVVRPLFGSDENRDRSIIEKVDLHRSLKHAGLHRHRTVPG